ARVPRNLPLLVCDRGMIQVTIDEAGNHHYRARYLLKKLNTDTLDIELPAPADTCIQNVYLDQLKINQWTKLDNEWNVARLAIDPRIFRQNVLLEIEYKLRASSESSGAWQTTLYPPVLR